MLVLISIFCLMLLILFHELGHFISAKLFHIKVTDFSIGMGPAILKKTVGETTYRLSALPLGGYVAIEGEDGNKEDPRSLLNAAWWKQMIVFLAGITCNLVIGFLLLGILVFPYKYVILPTITEIPTEITAAYGLEAGDKILQIDSFNIYSVNDLAYAEALDRDGKLTLSVYKPDSNYVHTYTVDRDPSLSIAYSAVFQSKEASFSDKLEMTKDTFLTISQLTMESLKLLFSGQVSVQEMSGPIGIVDTAASAASSYDFAYIMAFISINLGYMNLLPIPALDGGQALICLLQAVTKREFNRKVLGYVNTATMLLLLGLIIVVSVSDISKLF